MFLVCGVPAAAQTIYTGQLSIYSVAIPRGWSEADGGDNVDAAFVPPAGKAYGSIFVGVMYARRSLEEEIDYVVGSDPERGRRHLSIQGMPCMYAASTGSRGERNNHLACQFTVPFSDGARKVTFFMGSASRPQEYAAQTGIFWDMADTLNWRDDVTKGDAQDDQDDGGYDSDDAPGTWVLYVSPPGTGYADPRPPYEQWVVFQRYQGLADCLAARMPAHYEYWKSDQDLSMRVLNGICFNPDTREIRGER